MKQIGPLVLETLRATHTAKPVLMRLGGEAGNPLPPIMERQKGLWNEKWQRDYC
jgi:hypothetical protein